jgi:hypothetical protein
MGDPRDDKWDERADKAYSNFTDRPKRTAAKWFAIVLGVILALSLLGGIIAWVSSWGGEAARITGPDNTRQQAFALRDAYTSLDAAAQNVCDVQKSSGDSKEGDPTIIGGDPALQFKATYRRIEQDYNRRMSNAFEAGWVKNYPFLDDLPDVAPTLEEKLAEIGCS